MLLNYNSGWYDDMSIIAELQQAFPNDVWDQGSSPIELGQVAYHFQLTQIFPTQFSPEAWDDLLKSFGPLLIGVPADPHHALIVAGINIIDGNDASSTRARVHVMDPQHTDEWMTFDAFTHTYETDRSDFSQNIYRY
jgi:hypothetical protein